MLSIEYHAQNTGGAPPRRGEGGTLKGTEGATCKASMFCGRGGCGRAYGPANADADGWHKEVAFCRARVRISICEKNRHQSGVASQSAARSDSKHSAAAFGVGRGQ
jgi:hypothetical protein